MFKIRFNLSRNKLLKDTTNKFLKTQEEEALENARRIAEATTNEVTVEINEIAEIAEIAENCREIFAQAKQNAKQKNYGLAKEPRFHGMEDFVVDKPVVKIPKELTAEHLRAVQTAIDPFLEPFIPRILPVVHPDLRYRFNKNSDELFGRWDELVSPWEDTFCMMEPYRKPEELDPLEADLIELFGLQDKELKRSRESLTWDEINTILIPHIEKKIRSKIKELELPDITFTVMVSPLVLQELERDFFSPEGSLPIKKYTRSDSSEFNGDDGY